MTTDPKTSLAPERLGESAKTQLDDLLTSGLADGSLRDLLGLRLSSLGSAERQAYLIRTPSDKANGFYPRSLKAGSLPLPVEVPRTRSGAFRPSSLPDRYQRGYSEENQALLLSVLAASRSVSAAKDALRQMGLSISGQDLDQVATSLVEELELRNTRPLDPDLLVLFLDGQYVEIRDGDPLRPACIYLATSGPRRPEARPHLPHQVQP